MAPKARPKVKAKAKARLGPMRARAKGGAGGPPPRRRGALVLRRPGARVEVEREEGDASSKWKKGEEMILRDVPVEEFRGGISLVITEGHYYHNVVKIAGLVHRVVMEGERVELQVLARGTTSEGLLRAHTADPLFPFTVLVCRTGCGHVESGDRYVHGVKGYLQKEGMASEDWMTNLMAAAPAPREDEADELVELIEKERRRVGEGGSQGPSSNPGRPCGGGPKEGAGERQEKETEEERQEEEVRKEGLKFRAEVLPRWSPSGDGFSEEVPGALCWHGSGCQREDPQASCKEGQKDPVEETWPQQEFFREFNVQFKQVGQSRERGRGSLHGGQQGKGCGGEVPRCSMSREFEGYETMFVGGPRGRPWGRQQQTRGDHVLQAGDPTKGLWSHGKGDAESLGGPGSFDQGQASSSGGHYCTTPEKLRDGPEWDPLVRGSEDGAADQRSQQHRPAHGASPCPQGDLLRVENQLLGVAPPWSKERRERSRTRRKERQRPREERRKGPSRQRRKRFGMERKGEERKGPEREVRSREGVSHPMAEEFEGQRVSEEYDRVKRAGRSLSPDGGISGSGKAPMLMRSTRNGAFPFVAEGCGLEPSPTALPRPETNEGLAEGSAAFRREKDGESF